MLLLKPNCECCDRDLPPESTAARICSYECTFCEILRERCAEGRMSQLQRQPRRAACSSSRDAAEAPGVDRTSPASNSLPSRGVSVGITRHLPID